MGQLVYQVYYTRYQVSFYLWQIGPVLKHCKVPKSYDQDFRFSGIYLGDDLPTIKNIFIKEQAKGLKYL